MDLEKKKLKEAEWFRQHELNDDQLEKLIEEKFIRASEYRKAFLVKERQAELA
jgi:hypothetical protein